MTVHKRHILLVPTGLEHIITPYSLSNKRYVIGINYFKRKRLAMDHNTDNLPAENWVPMQRKEASPGSLVDTLPSRMKHSCSVLTSHFLISSHSQSPLKEGTHIKDHSGRTGTYIQGTGRLTHQHCCFQDIKKGASLWSEDCPALWISLLGAEEHTQLRKLTWKNSKKEMEMNSDKIMAHIVAGK